MDVENIVAEFQLDDNVVYVIRRDYLNKDYKKITDFPAY